MVVELYMNSRLPTVVDIVHWFSPKTSMLNFIYSTGQKNAFYG